MAEPESLPPEKTDLDRLREAENLLRGHAAVDPPARTFLLAVADTLRQAATDLWAHGPLCCPDGCDECDDALWMPHVRRSVAVANAYLQLGARPSGERNPHDV